MLFIKLCSSYCNTTGESESSNDNLSEQQRQEIRDFNTVVNPNKVYCVDFCVNTYTRANPNDGNTVEFVDNNRLSSYITSNCAACIDNYYDRLNLIRNPNPVVNCTEHWTKLNLINFILFFLINYINGFKKIN